MRLVGLLILIFLLLNKDFLEGCLLDYVLGLKLGYNEIFVLIVLLDEFLVVESYLHLLFYLYIIHKPRHKPNLATLSHLWIKISLYLFPI